MFAVPVLKPTWLKAMIALALVVMLTFASLQAGHADSAGQRSTRNIILAATAVTLGIVLYENAQHAAVSANTVVGRTRDGGVVYGDGRMIYPGGMIVYASNDGIHLCAFYGFGARCSLRAVGYPWRYEDEQEWHGEGLHKGWDKHHGNPHDDNGQGEGQGGR